RREPADRRGGVPEPAQDACGVGGLHGCGGGGRVVGRLRNRSRRCVMRVALLQGPEASEADGALAEVAASARSAAESGAAILVCSELTCTGFRHPLSPEPRPGGQVQAPIGRAMRQAAREAGIAIAYGYVEQGQDDGPGEPPLYNAV